MELNVQSMHMTEPDRCVQGGYNMLFGLWKYAWDADCELFLKILRGELKEGVYIQQAQLQVCGCLHTDLSLHSFGSAL